LDIRALRIERTLCRCYEQSKNERGDCGDQADAKSHDVFCVLVEMMLRQSAAKQRAQKNAAERQYEYDGRES
jgi:hypothetical protein